MAIQSIGIDIREAHAGGAGKSRYCEELTKALLKKAPAHIRFVLFSNRFNAHFPSNDRIEQVVLKEGWRWHWRLKRHLKKHPVDLFVAPTSYIYPSIAPRSQKVALVIHDLVAFLYPEHHHWFPTFIERFALRRALDRADTVCTVSENTWKDLCHLYPRVRSKKHMVLHPGVGPEFRPLDFVKIHTPKRFLLAVGTLQPRKNFPAVFKAFEQIASLQPDLDLCVIGGLGWKTSQIFAQVPDALKERIHFLGYIEQEELVQWYNKAELFLFPSFYEGFGIPPLEAMACGCPAITSNSSSLPEAVGDAALTVGPHDIPALVEAIQRLLNPEERQKFVEKGLQRASQFKWEQAAEKLLRSL